MIPVSIVLAILCFVAISGPFISDLTSIIVYAIAGYSGANVFLTFIMDLIPIGIYASFPLGLMIIAILSIKFKPLSIASFIMSNVYCWFLFLNAMRWLNDAMYYAYGAPIWYYFVIFGVYLLRYLFTLLIVLVSLINLVLFIILSVKEMKEKKKEVVVKEKSSDTDEVTSEMIEETIQEQH